MSLFKKSRIGKNSIKESLDNLPSGVCYAKRNGIIVLINRRMNALAHDLTGRDLQHLYELQDALASPCEAVKLISPGQNMYQFPDGTVWRFTQSHIVPNGEDTFVLIVAADVTELYRKENELKRENAELEEVNARAKALYAQLDRIVRDEENLALKAKIHDELGMTLLKSRQALTEDASLEDMRLMGIRWAHIAETLGISEDEAFGEPDFSPADEIAELTELTRGIGIALHIDGTLPQSRQSAGLILSAIRECAANAKRHAEATEMYVTLTDTAGRTKAEITNNGRIPEGEITEGGGLLALRNRMEKVGGIMTVQSLPIFRLTLILAMEESI